MILSLLFSVVVVTGMLMLFYPRWRKRYLLAQPLPAPWLAVVTKKIPFFGKLRPEERQQLIDLIRLFVADKQYFGCGGLQITDEIRITIAAEACLLLLNRNTGIYPDLRYILVYPHAFLAAHDKLNADGTHSDGSVGLLGESWVNGKIILSWDDVEGGLSNWQDGHNVVLHEFAHQLDSEDGSVNGAPLLPGSSIKSWATVFSTEFAQLNAAAEKHHHAVMDYYGATNPAEFFAVATETFFEKPLQLDRLHPLLYAQLSKYYRVDPRQWL